MAKMYYNNVINSLEDEMLNNSPPKGVGSRRRRRHCRWQDRLMTLMASTVAAPVQSEINVGRRLRELRTGQGLSIRSLAELSGLNFNTLSLIENEKSSPSVTTLQQLALALGVPIVAFFETESVYNDVVYQKSGQRPRAVFDFGLFEDMGRGLTLGGGLPLLITLEPGAGSGPEAIVHTGQEFVYCVKGCLTYTVADRVYTLEADDSLIFQAHLPHRWQNLGKTIARSILILCPSDQNDGLAERHFTLDRLSA